MLHASTQKLIQKLYELTESGDIAWKEGRDGRCTLDTEGYRVEINEEPPLLRLLGADGRELEKAEAADLSAVPWVSGEGTFGTRVADMSRRAQRVARGAEQAISKILSSLSAPPTKAPEPEPVPTAIEFEPQIARKPGPVSYAESPAAIAALGADLAMQRRSSPPSLPHAAPTPAPAPEPLAPPPKADTAVSAPFEASAPKVELPVAAAEEKRPLEEAPAPPPRAPIPVPPIAASNPPPITSFTGPPPVAPKAPTPSNLFVTGFSAVARPPAPPAPQPAPVAPEPQPQPVAPPAAAAPTPAPAPKAEPPKPPRTGADLYKPWS